VNVYWEGQHWNDHFLNKRNKLEEFNPFAHELVVINSMTTFCTFKVFFNAMFNPNRKKIMVTIT
jgi:hypothetical protein